MLRGIAITLILTLMLVFFGYWITDQIQISGNKWLDWVIEIITFWGFVAILFVLFPAIATFCIAFFLDNIAEAVERRYYPLDPLGTKSSTKISLSIAFRYTSILILLNILAIPLYLVPVMNIFIYYALNSYLLSREYFELVGQRHMQPLLIRQIRKSAQTRIIIAGIGITFLMTMPVINLFAPLIATAIMVHMIKSLTTESAN